MTEKASALEPTSDPMTAPSAADPLGPITRSDGRGMEPSGAVGNTQCAGCGAHDELRGGYCFDCASAGELRAVRRTTVQHLRSALRHVLRAVGYGVTGERADARNVLLYARIDARWAWERAAQTGDYRRGGYFDREYPNWRTA